MICIFPITKCRMITIIYNENHPHQKATGQLCNEIIKTWTANFHFYFHLNAHDELELKLFYRNSPQHGFV